MVLACGYGVNMHFAGIIEFKKKHSKLYECIKKQTKLY